ncbi:MAG: nitroreductase family protein [Methanothrix sp.]|nr:nitroreductase family protein [Methanothrix sp.]
MGVSAAKVAVICLFLILGMALAGFLMQPKGSLEAWEVKESHFPSKGTSEDKLVFLLNYAILAPSSHNSQPWKFNLSGNVIRLFADRSGWLQVADADQRELHISLGCALENLLVAAEHFGYSYRVIYLPENEDSVASINLIPNGEPSLYPDTAIFQAILTRHTNRLPYQSRPVPEGAIKTLQNRSAKEGVRIYLISDSGFKNKFCELVVSADQIQYSDVDYKSELGHWLGQGMMGPTGIQALIAQMNVVLLDVGPEQTRNDAELVNSTPVLGFIISEKNDREAQIRAGQAFERLWLEATAMNLSVHPMSQALEVPETKAKLAELLPGGYLQQAFLLGFAEPVAKHTPRRPLEEAFAK